MKHLSEEQLLEHYYGEGEHGADNERHLLDCAQCSAAYQALRADLADIKAIPVPSRAEDYGDAVWNSIRSSVPAYEKKRWQLFNSTALLRFGYAGGLALLIVFGFIAGRLWEHSRSRVVEQADNSGARQRVVLVVLGDHLERSERLLVELKHAGANDRTLPIQEEAHDLLLQNRLYRESAEQVGDPALSAALDHLERVLVEIANEPGGLSPADATRVQKEMNSDGLLFEIRVLRANVSDRENNGAPKSKGVRI
jgi:hypothetical protein